MGTAGNRRVVSYDGRKVNGFGGNIPASTFEKCGGTIPPGPKFINDHVEKELANYKVEVEQKFKASHANNNYVFLRTAPNTTIERPFHIKDSTAEARGEIIRQEEQSASPQSRLIQPKKISRTKEVANLKTLPRDEFIKQPIGDDSVLLESFNQNSPRFEVMFKDAPQGAKMGPKMNMHIPP